MRTSTLECAYCGELIDDAPTGLMELQALQNHLQYNHKLLYPIDAVLRLRAEWEEQGLRRDIEL